MPKTAEPQTTIGTAWATLLALVPPRCRARATELALILHGEYAAGEAAADRDGHDRGFSEGQQAGREEAQAGYKDGWDRGYATGLAHVIGHIGVPALPRQDRDPLLPQPDEPPPVS